MQKRTKRDPSVSLAPEPRGKVPDPAGRDDPSVYPPPETMAKLFPNLAHTQEFTRELNRTWTRFMTGK